MSHSPVVTIGKLSAGYVRYMRSPTWRKRRQDAIKRQGHRCERCKMFRFRKGDLQVHHLTYDRLGKERNEDLQVVCRHCHDVADQERMQRVQAESANALWQARVDGWARAKYGENWLDCSAPGTIEDEFVDWLDRQEEH